MLQKMKKLLVLMCVLALAMPAIPAKAAATIPKFKTTYASLYENASSKGKYTFTLQNLKKGQIVKWKVTGAGKSYVSLSKTQQKVTGTTASNVLTVKTNGKLAAKNKQVKLTAVIYSSANKKQATVTTTAKLKVRPTAVSITAPAEASETLLTGKSYNFAYKLTPANATSSNTWSVTASDGTDYSSYMSSTGVFTPMKAGTYTIRIAANIGTKTIRSATKTVDVADYMVSVQQTAANKLKVTYSGDVSALAEADDFTVENTAGAKIVVKSMTLSSDGTTAELTMYSNFKDGVIYTVDDGGARSLAFTASVGLPVKLDILTQTATVGKETTLAYALYDQNGVDVSAAYEGTMSYDDAEVTNGYLTEDHKLYMTTVGKTAIITMKYTSKTDSSLVLVDTEVITCVAAATSANTNFTLTTGTADVDYGAAGYTDNRKVSLGSTYYAHFRALDTDQTEIKYSAVKFESSDPDTMIITSTGKITPIKTGTVKVIVTATYADEEYTYSYEVTIAEAPYLKSIQLSTSSVSMSNVYNADYRKYIAVSAVDQYGESFPLTGETAAFTNNSTIKANLASYDAAQDRIVLNASSATAGTYSYTLTVSSGSHKASADFTLVVSAVPATGTTTYQIEIDRTVDDLSLNTDVSGSKYVNVRLAQYRGGVFTNYAMFTSAVVTQGSDYYGSDLTVSGTTAKQTISGANLLSLKTLDITSGVCRKAETGTYQIALQYYSTESKGYVTLTTSLTLTDTQEIPDLHIDRIQGTKTAATALELAADCIRVDGAAITECVVTGETQPGSKVAIKSGDQVNIRSVTVTLTYTIAAGENVTLTYSMSVGKTLTNL